MKQRVSFNQKIFWAMVLVMWPPSIFTHVKTLSISICVNIIIVNIISTVSLCVTDLVPKSLSLSPQPNVSTIFLGGRYWHSSGAGQIGLTQIEKQIQKDKITPKTDFPSFFQTNVKSLLIKTMTMTDTEGVVFPFFLITHWGLETYSVNLKSIFFCEVFPYGCVWSKALGSFECVVRVSGGMAAWL